MALCDAGIKRKYQVVKGCWLSLLSCVLCDIKRQLESASQGHGSWTGITPTRWCIYITVAAASKPLHAVQPVPISHGGHVLGAARIHDRISLGTVSLCGKKQADHVEEPATFIDWIQMAD